MELKVSVDGVERCISGLTEDTTCAQIIYALAHATGQKGRFVLVERYRDTERSLAPTDRPLEMLKKWGEHALFVSFILKRLDSASSSTTNDSYSLKSSSESPCQNVFSSVFPQEPLLPFNPERSSSPIAKFMEHEVDVGVQQTSTFKPQPSKNVDYELPKSISDASLKPELPRSTGNTASYNFSCGSAVTQVGSLNSRPPPPAYHEVIQQRYNSLTRGGAFTIPRPSLWHPNVPQSSDSVDAKPIIGTGDTYLNDSSFLKNTANLSPSELEKLIESQQVVIDGQKTFLLEFDSSTTDGDQRELMQLERQQANLRLVLNPLRARNVPELLLREKTELEKIRAMISDLQFKMENNAKRLGEQALLERKLTEEIAALEEEVKNLESSASIAEDSLDSPMREMLIS